MEVVYYRYNATLKTVYSNTNHSSPISSIL